MAAEETINQTCDPCKFRGVDSSSVKYCKTCQEQLCKGCADVHKSSKATRKHFLVNIKDINVNSVTGIALEVLQRCISHPQKLLEFFCVEHNHLICSTCLLLHQSDNCTNVIEVAKAGEALLQSTFTEKVKADLHSVKLKLEQDKNSIKLQQTATKKAHTYIKEMLCETRAKLFHHFHKLENEILTKVQSDELNENKELEILHERINEMLVRLSDTSSVFQSAIENGSGSDIFRCILLIGNYLEDCEARLDMKKTTIGICQHSIKLSTALHLLLNENIRMMERSERHYQFFISEFPSLQMSFSEVLKISSRSDLCIDSNSRISDSDIESTTRGQCVDSNNDCKFDPNVVRLSGEDIYIACDMGNMQHSHDFLPTSHKTAQPNPLMMNMSALCSIQPTVGPLFLPYQPPVLMQSVRPLFDMGMQPCPPPFTHFSHFCHQHPPPTVPTNIQDYHSATRYVELNKETIPPNEVHTSPVTKGKTDHTFNSQMRNAKKEKEKSEETIQVLSEQTVLQHNTTVRTFVKPPLGHMASNKDEDLEELVISNQHQKKHVKREISLTRSQRRRRRRAGNHTTELTTDNAISVPDSKSTDKDAVKIFNVSVEHSDASKVVTIEVNDSSTTNELPTGVNASGGIHLPVYLKEEVDNYHDETLNERKDANKIVLEVEESDNSKCSYCVEQVTKDPLYLREPIKHTVQMGSDRNDEVLNECRENSSGEPVKKVLINLSEPSNPVIQTESDSSEPVLNECYKCTKEPVENEFISLAELTIQIVQTEDEKANLIPNERRENEKEQVEKEMMQTNIEKCDCDTMKDQMLEYDKHFEGAIATIRDDIDDISKECEPDQDENVSDIRESVGISLPIQSKHYENNREIPIHSDKIKYTEEHAKRIFPEQTEGIKQSQLIDAEFDIKSESVLKVPWQRKKKFDLFSVLAPSNDRIMVCDFCNRRIIMLDKQLKTLDTFQFPKKIVNVNLLKGQRIASCHKNRNKISLTDYLPTFKPVRVFSVEYSAMCVQSVDDTNMLVSMCDFVGHWHLHMMSNTGQLIKKLKLKRTILDGYSIAVMFSGTFRFGYRIIQCCEESDALYCFEKDGKDIFKFNVPSPNCVAVHDSGYIFVIDHFNNIHVLSSSGQRLYKAKCCSDVTSIAITPSMDKLLLTRYKDDTVTVLSVVSKFNKKS
ncbi:uncharacterized protein LOC123565974 [Mercenaria mercenaria]|uniref:uncharacterized protein LOC123565974 n=1 Tax=Mercenaria mercenaria TaxID=6596 RepID=UPI00234F199A|nr:uncharacterized protein LOC123565974 [Mercenaria mercenaria]